MPALGKTAVFARLRPLVAASAALLILTLAVFAVSPGWHRALHRDGAPASSEGCAIDLFAQGVSLPLGAVAAQPAEISARQKPAVVAQEIFLASPRYLHQPERGPPPA